MTEFERINQPRVDRALHQIELIEKSAASMRIKPDVFQALIAPVQHKVRPGSQQQVAPMGGNFEEPFTPISVASSTKPVAKEQVALANLSTQQLVDRMIACGAELAKRRQ